VGTRVDVSAPVGVLWEVLTDFDAYSQWNPFTPSAQGKLMVREPVRLRVQIPGHRALWQTEWINRVEPGRCLYWGTHFGHRALLTANRSQEVESISESRSRYTTADRFSGLLVPLVFAIFGRGLEEGFESVGLALKERCEALHRQRAG
jgi:hypothetical protein